MLLGYLLSICKVKCHGNVLIKFTHGSAKYLSTGKGMYKYMVFEDLSGSYNKHYKGLVKPSKA